MLNPLDTKLMALLRSTKVLLKRDRFCLKDLAAFSSGKLG